MPQLPWPELAAGRRKVRLQREVSTALARVELVVRTEEGVRLRLLTTTQTRWTSSLLVQLELLRHVGQMS